MKVGTTLVREGLGVLAAFQLAAGGALMGIPIATAEQIAPSYGSAPFINLTGPGGCLSKTGGTAADSVQVVPGTTVTLYSPNGTDDYSGSSDVRVYCGLQSDAEPGYGYLQGVQVSVEVTDEVHAPEPSPNPPDIFARGTVNTGVGSDEVKVLGAGSAPSYDSPIFDAAFKVRLRSTNDNLNAAGQPVATRLTWVVKVGSTTLGQFENSAGGGIRAQNGNPPQSDTPELGSVALFSSGLLGAIGYVVSRRRASRRA